MDSSKPKILEFFPDDKDIFEAVVRGEKTIETRAGGKYDDIKGGDTIELVCGNQRISKKVSKIELFESVEDILKKYKPRTLNPNISTAEEARKMWEGSPGYKERLRKYGLVAFHLE